MAKMKKQDWIDAICKLDDENEGLLGEIDREELGNFTIGQLKALHKDMEDELSEGVNPEDSEPSDDSDKNDGSKFLSMCGAEFNPQKSGECFKQCQVDFPEAFEACLADYKTKESVTSKPKKESKPKRGKTEWGHLKSSQAGLIDDFFFDGKVGSLAEVAEFTGGKEPRCLHHMRHLVADLNVKIQYSFRKDTVKDKDGNEKTVQTKIYWWHEADKRRKGDDLEGKSAY